MAHGFDDWSDWSASKPAAPSSSHTAPDEGGWANTEPPGRAALTAARPPVMWLWLALAAGVVGGVLALILGQAIPVAVAAWVVAGPAAFTLLAHFTARDTRLRSAPLYVAPAWVPLLYRISVVIALVGIVCAAWRIADWAGRTW